MEHRKLIFGLLEISDAAIATSLLWSSRDLLKSSSHVFRYNEILKVLNFEYINQGVSA